MAICTLQIIQERSHYVPPVTATLEHRLNFTHSSAVG
nr:MAG TPA: hypothetical protein [Bacteriophage sp.]